MTTGTAARLEAIRHLAPIRPAQNSDQYDQGDLCRAYWSVFLLEKAFCPQLTLIGNIINPPPCPEDGDVPPTLIPTTDRRHALDTESDVPDGGVGINSFCFEIISIWSDINLYISELKAGKAEKPWSPDSSHAKLFAKIYDFEARIPSEYMLRVAKIQNRPITEIKNHQEFWTSWILLQFSIHATCAVLCHPFIHLFVMQRKQRHKIPRLFLKQMIDQAHYHSAWIAKLITVCEKLPLKLSNPIIWQMISGAASIAWLLQFSSDVEISETATKGFKTCVESLRSTSPRWFYLEKKVSITWKSSRQVWNIDQSRITSAQDTRKTSIVVRRWVNIPKFTHNIVQACGCMGSSRFWHRRGTLIRLGGINVKFEGQSSL